MMGMASNHLFASGSFVGDGTVNASLNIGFEPDVVVVKINKAFDESGWRGAGDFYFSKGRIATIDMHTTATATVHGLYYNYIYQDQDAYGASATDTYKAYGQYSNGTFTISNTSDNVNTRFISGETYTWQAYKMK